MLEILGNSHFEAYIGGPIAGVIAGLLFSALGSRAVSSNGVQAPAQVRIEVVSHTEVVQNNHKHQQSGDDALAMVIGAGLLGIIAAFLFAAYLPQIAFALTFFITSVAMFSITVLLCATISGRLHTWVWLQHVILPFFASLAAFAVVDKANAGIFPEVVSLAQRLIATDKITVAVVLNGAFNFMKHISADYIQWMVFIMFAFVCAAIGTLYAFFQCIHYVALANSQNSPSSFWTRLAIWTLRFCGWKNSLVGVFFLVLGWFCATGQFYAFLH